MIDYDCLIDYCFIFFVLFLKKLLNIILLYYSDLVFLFYFQKIISEYYQKMESVYEELLVSLEILCYDIIERNCLIVSQEVDLV